MSKSDITMLNSDICLAYDYNIAWANCAAANPSNLTACNKYGSSISYLNAVNATNCCAFTDTSLLWTPGILSAGSSQCGATVTSNKNNVNSSCCAY